MSATPELQLVHKFMLRYVCARTVYCWYGAGTGECAKEKIAWLECATYTKMDFIQR